MNSMTVVDDESASIRGRTAWLRLTAAQVLSVMVVATAALLFALKPLSLAMPFADLDGSWMVVVGQAATIPARWGVDLAFTYGPASALVTHYFTDGYIGLAVPAALVIALVLGLCITRLAVIAMDGLQRASFYIVLAAACEAAALLAAARDIPDCFYFALAFNVFLLEVIRLPGDAASRSIAAAGAATMGAIALSKTSFGVLALVLFALADLRSATLRRQAPLLTLPFLLAFLTTFEAFGQHFSDLPIYVSRQSEVAAGYGEAMYLIGSRWELAGYLIAFGSLIVVTGATAWPRGGRRRGLLVAVGLIFVLLIVFKGAFVRADAHTQIGWATLGLVGLSIAIALMPQRSVPRAVLLASASLAILWIVAPLLIPVENVGDDNPQQWPPFAAIDNIRLGVAYEVGAWGRFLKSPETFEAGARSAKLAAFADVRAQHPLPRLAGTVDIIPSEQTSVIANGLAFHPRPSFQDYLTYTAGLIDANVAFYQGPSAPDWVLFGIGGLDDRYPAATEGALWPELLQDYEPVRQEGDLLALHRRMAPLPDTLGIPERRTLQLGESFTLPPGPMFARIVLRKTLLGRLAAAVFRSPALNLNVTLVDGETLESRFIPALGAGGFLLSPLIRDAGDFALLATGQGDELGGKTVKQAVLGGSRLARFFYAPDIALELRPLTVADAPPSKEARPLIAALDSRQAWRRLVRRIAPEMIFNANRLSVPPTTDLTVPVAGARRVKLTFGIEDEAWKTGRSEGVCFSVEAANGARISLWQRCLDPLRIAADRGPQSAEIGLPSSLDAILVKTTCPRSCDWGWSYWDDISPET